MKLSLDLLADCLLAAGAKPLSTPRSSPTFASVELVDPGKTRRMPLDEGAFYLSPSYPSPAAIEELSTKVLFFYLDNELKGPGLFSSFAERYYSKVARTRLSSFTTSMFCVQ